jgi:plastocyanin
MVQHLVIRTRAGIEYTTMNDDVDELSTLQIHSRAKSRRARTVAAIFLLGMALVLAACTSGSPSGAPTSTVSGGSSKADAIIIRNFVFSPDSLSVAPGATVTVTNDDQVTHTLTATKGGFNTGDIPGGTSKTFTAPNKPGMYSYICSIHQYMTGTLVVSG